MVRQEESPPGSPALARLASGFVSSIHDAIAGWKARKKTSPTDPDTIKIIKDQLAISTSTEDALERLAVSRYDLVISDMGRPPDNRAGYTLLEAMRRQGVGIPVVFYTGSGLPEHRAEARRRGAVSSTNSPQELVRLVTSTLLSG